MGRFGWLMALGCAALACSPRGHPSAEQDAGSARGTIPPAIIDPNDYEIYGLALASLGVEKGPLVIAREACEPVPQAIRRDLPGDAEAEERFIGPYKVLEPDLFRAVLSVPSGRLESGFSSAYTVELLDKSQLEAAFACQTDGGAPVDRWVCFHRKHQGPLIHFSRIAFNQARDKAVVEVGMACGILCAEGATLLFAYEKGRWFLSRKLSGWLS